METVVYLKFAKRLDVKHSHTGTRRDQSEVMDMLINSIVGILSQWIYNKSSHGILIIQFYSPIIPQ